MRIGLLGGTFDPVHCGHLAVARQVKDACALDRVWLIPAARSPFRGTPRAAAVRPPGHVPPGGTGSPVAGGPGPRAHAPGSFVHHRHPANAHQDPSRLGVHAHRRDGRPGGHGGMARHGCHLRHQRSRRGGSDRLRREAARRPAPRPSPRPRRGFASSTTRPAKSRRRTCGGASRLETRSKGWRRARWPTTSDATGYTGVGTPRRVGYNRGTS